MSPCFYFLMRMFPKLIKILPANLLLGYFYKHVLIMTSRYVFNEGSGVEMIYLVNLELR